ncbi:MAG: phage major capsid protein, partial [Pseudomonadota bacterium]
MLEVKADRLEDSFEAIGRDEDGVAALKQELELLKSRIEDGVIASQRVPLDGVKSAEAREFSERYLRLGIEAGLEQKSLDNATPGAGGFSIPREIDEKIDATLLAISPIRKIANVVKVGSSNYRKLIATGGYQSGWVGMEALRPETTTPTFTEVIPPSGDLYANPAASQHMLDDAMFD